MFFHAVSTWSAFTKSMPPQGRVRDGGQKRAKRNRRHSVLSWKRSKTTPQTMQATQPNHPPFACPCPFRSDLPLFEDSFFFEEDLQVFPIFGQRFLIRVGVKIGRLSSSTVNFLPEIRILAYFMNGIVNFSHNLFR
jgi:hypothetical protein